MTSEPTTLASLEEVEAWLRHTSVAGSALGRHVCQDQSLLSRWRRGGCSGVSEAKRFAVTQFIRANPNGSTCFNKKGARPLGNRLGSWSRQFAPGSKGTPLPQAEAGVSQKLPVPSLAQIDSESDVAWIKAKAFSEGRPIVRVLADLVALGIMVTKETDNEEL